MDEFPMQRAAKEGDLEMVRQLIAEDVSVDSRDEKGRTPMHWAAEGGHYEVVDFLSGLPECDLNPRDGEGCTPVLVAANYKKKTVVDLLLQRGAQVNCASDYKWNLLHHASYNNWAEVVQYILDRGEVDLNAATRIGNTPLMLAACKGHEEIATLLIGAGADVNRTGAQNRTALHDAAFCGHTRVLQLLLEVEGLDLNPRNEEGRTPLHNACSKGHRGVVENLLVAGADTTIKDNKGETALSVGIREEKLTIAEIRLFVQHGASFEDCDYVRISQNTGLKESVFKDVDLVRKMWKGDLERVRQLIDGGFSVDSRDDQGRTPMHWAAEEGHYEVVDFLRGLPECDLNLRDGEGRTPVLVAAKYNKKTVVDLLLQRGAQVNCADDNYKWNLLHYASRRNWADLVQYILDRGEVDLNAATCSGNTPLMWAAREGHEEVAAILIGAGADVNRSDTYKVTALHLAAFNGRSRVLQLLLEVEGLDLNPQDKQGLTPLHVPCYMGHREIVEKLLVAGADTTIKSNEGETALNIGIRKEKLTIAEIRLFVQHGASFEDCDYVRISQNPDLKESIFKDVDLVTQSIVNKLNRQSLPALKCIPKFAGKLPSTDVLKVAKADAWPKVMRVMCKLSIVLSLFLALPLTSHGSAALVVKGLKYIF